MPSSYAHYQFGAQALPTLPADIRFPIQRYRTLYDLGLQGPDFFFYYKLGKDSPVTRLARKYHYQSGSVVFSKICRDLGHPTDTELAYLYGLLGHYCLDAHCHPLVHEASGEDNLAHNAIESEFDRFLMERGGIRKPHSYDRGVHLKCGRGCGPIIARFYPEAEPAQILESLNTMALVLRLLTIHPAAKQVLKLLGGAYPGLLMHTGADPEHMEQNGALLERFNRALARYPDYLQQLHSHLAFSEPFDEEFDAIFG